MWTSHILLLSLIFLFFGQFCKYKIQVWGAVKNGNKRVNSVFFPERGPWGWVGKVVGVRWGSMSITFSKLPSASCTVCCNDCNRLHLCGFASTLLSFSSSPSSPSWRSPYKGRSWKRPQEDEGGAASFCACKMSPYIFLS